MVDLGGWGEDETDGTVPATLGEDGGSLRLESGDEDLMALLEIPLGAIAQETFITLNSEPDPKTAGVLVAPGSAVFLSPSWLTFQPANPGVEFSFQVDPSLLPPDSDPGDPTGRWGSIEDGQLDTSEEVQLTPEGNPRDTASSGLRNPSGLCQI